MSKKKIYEYEGRKYAFIEDKEQDECERCALKDKCHDEDGLICTDLLGISNDNAVGRRFEEVNEDALTEEQAYNEYQERSKVSGDRAEQLAWAMIVLLAGQLIGGSKYAEFYVLGGAALLYLLLSAMQSVWQSVTIWLVKCRIKRTGIQLNDYPDWVGFGAWVFYWLKMIIIAIGAIYGASHFISFAM